MQFQMSVVCAWYSLATSIRVASGYLSTSHGLRTLRVFLGGLHIAARVVEVVANSTCGAQPQDCETPAGCHRVRFWCEVLRLALEVMLLWRVSGSLNECSGSLRMVWSGLGRLQVGTLESYLSPQVNKGLRHRSSANVQANDVPSGLVGMAVQVPLNHDQVRTLFIDFMLTANFLVLLGVMIC